LELFPGGRKVGSGQSARREASIGADNTDDMYKHIRGRIGLGLLPLSFLSSAQLPYRSKFTMSLRVPPLAAPLACLRWAPLGLSRTAQGQRCRFCTRVERIPGSLWLTDIIEANAGTRTLRELSHPARLLMFDAERSLQDRDLCEEDGHLALFLGGRGLATVVRRLYLKVTPTQSK